MFPSRAILIQTTVLANLLLAIEIYLALKFVLNSTKTKTKKKQKFLTNLMTIFDILFRVECELNRILLFSFLKHFLNSVFGFNTCFSTLLAFAYLLKYSETNNVNQQFSGIL